MELGQARGERGVVVAACRRQRSQYVVRGLRCGRFAGAVQAGMRAIGGVSAVDGVHRIEHRDTIIA
jgi:hypothetical protein